jgi:beta-lactamase class A
MKVTYPLMTTLQKYAADLPGRHGSVDWGLSVRRDGIEIASINPDRVFQTASIGKVFLLIAASTAIVSGQRSRLDPIQLQAADIVGDSGIWQFMTERTLSLDSVCILIASVSDNCATNALLSEFTLPVVQAQSQELGIDDTRMLDRIRDVRTGADPIGPSQSKAGDLSQLMYQLGMDRDTGNKYSLVSEWLSLNTDLSMVSSAFNFDPLAHNELTEGGKFFNKTGTDVGVQAEAGCYVKDQTVWTYSMIANWSDQNPNVPMEVKNEMNAFGRLLASMIM